MNAHVEPWLTVDATPVHDARVLTEGGYGQSSDLEIQAKEILRIRSLMEEMLANDTGQEVAKVSKDIERDKFLTAQEAVEYGIVDDILPSLKEVD